MKKLTAILLSVLMILPLCLVGGGSIATEAATTTDLTVTDTTTSDELPLDQGITDTSVSLSRGDDNIYVKQLQTSLNTIMDAGLVVDGDFGSATETAVIRFQAKYGLVADGVVGPATIAKINDFILNGVPEDPETGYDRGYVGGQNGSGEVLAHGLDVSTWQQGNIDFDAIKAAGYDFVILRCGYSGGKDGGFETFYAQARAAGLDIGTYYYSYALTAEEAYQDALDTISYISGKTFEYPVWLDYEDESQKYLSSSLDEAICLTYMDTIASYGYLTGLYTFISFSEGLPLDSICAKYDLWMAHYYDDTYQSKHDRYSTTTGMYQYTSSKYVSGSGGPYDANVAYKDFPSIVQQYGFNGYDASGEPTTPPANQGVTNINVSLSRGDVSVYVEQLQKSLNTIMDAGLVVDGDFGSATEAAVKSFQKKYSLTANGVAGTATLAKINQLIENGIPEDSDTGYSKGYTGGMKGTGSVVAKGIDVSVWQSSYEGGYVDFNAVKAAGYDYVILRCGYSGVKDKAFEEFYTQAKAAGLDVGVHFLGYATTAAEAYQDALDTLSYLEGKIFEYPIYYDYIQTDLSNTLDADICLTYLDTLATNGYLAGLYVLSENMSNIPIYTICAKYDLWVANYVGNYETMHDTYSTTTGMYQYTCEEYIGEYGPYMADVSYKDYRSICMGYGFNGYGLDREADGDADGDGVLTNTDLTLLVRYLSGYTTEVASADNLDFNGDGKVNNRDAISMIKVLVYSVRNEGETEVVYYNQWDDAYAYEPYGTDLIGTDGCGPTAMAIVISTLTNETVDPIDMANWSYENGYWASGNGSYHSLIPAAAEAWGLPVEGCSASEGQRIVDALANGKLIVAIMVEGHFTSSGHFIVLRGVRNGKILVADPASYERSAMEWDLDIILDEAHTRPGANGPFWIIG